MAGDKKSSFVSKSIIPNYIFHILEWSTSDNVDYDYDDADGGGDDCGNGGEVADG